MPKFIYRRYLWPAVILLLTVLGLRYGLPLALPFLAGILLALAAEAPVRFLCHRLSMSRGTAAALGVSLTLVLLTALGLLLFSAAFQVLRRLASIAPDLESTARQGLTALQDWLLSLARNAPEGIQPFLTKSVLSLFDSGGAIYSQAVSALPALAAGILSHITGGFLGIGTAILSAYLISARLPKLKQWFRDRMPDAWEQKYRPSLLRIRSSLGGWLKAQSRLLGLTFCIVCIGLFLLQVRYAPVWAVLIALVDAVPMLGTGLVLVPWSMICFLQNDPFRAVGLLLLFTAATLARSVLEPRLVGQHMGLDPLVTLIALYLGYQLLGLPGLLAAPLLAVTAIQIFKTTPEES